MNQHARSFKRNPLQLAAGALCTALSCNAQESRELEDPTQPTATASVVLATPVPTEHAPWLLSGIKIEPHRRLAVINNLVVPLHGEVDGARVVDIEMTQVIIEHDGKRQTLRLLPSAIKKRSVRANTR